MKRIILFSFLLLVFLIVYFIEKGFLSNRVSTMKADVVMSVNGKEITNAEYHDMLGNTKQMIGRLERQKQTLKNVPDSQTKKMVEAQTEKQLQAGQEKLALTIILTDYSLRSEAEKRGLTVSAEEAKQFSQQMRKQLMDARNNGLPENDEGYLEYKKQIAEMGEEKYWNDYAPKLYGNSLIKAKLKRAVLSEGKEWEQFQYDLVKKADVKIHDPKIKTTKKDILNYIKSLIQLRTETKVPLNGTME